MLKSRDMPLQNISEKVITRFPPSPTGFFHIGSARTALFNYLFAKKNNGVLYLRFEDTDKARSKKEYEDDIRAGLEWLGIECTLPEVARQSERMHIYRAQFTKLLESGAAYEAESTADDKSKKVIRFKNPNIRIVFQDLIRGEVSFDTTELGDFVIAKSLEEPLYHLAVVIDDHEMAVTHVIRGEDGISNTPRQILILEALGFTRPSYAHIPLILAPDRSKLSKRHGAVSVTEYKNMGFLSEALVNYLALLGWNPGGDKEIFNMDELISEFDLSRVHKAGAIFSEEKLRWFNKEHLKKNGNYQISIINEVRKLFPEADDQIVKKIVPIVFERIEVLSDINKLADNGELLYYFSQPTYKKEDLHWKGEKDTDNTKIYLTETAAKLESLDKTFDADTVRKALWTYAEEKGKGNVLWPLRFALSGREKSPDPFTLASILGKNETLRRIRRAAELLS